MKRSVTAILLCLAFALCLSACGNSQTSGSPGNTMTETNEQFLKQMLKYLPQLGISIKKISDDTGVS